GLAEWRGGQKATSGPGHRRAARAILADVSIGGTLAEARQRAGLTVAEVSTRTRIGQGLIRAIEQDEFAACGGDFYARGHIRAIAAVVGADPQPLISQYDEGHPYGSSATLEELLKRQPPRTPRRPRPRRRRARVAGSGGVPVRAGSDRLRRHPAASRTGRSPAARCRTLESHGGADARRIP